LPLLVNVLVGGLLAMFWARLLHASGYGSLLAGLLALTLLAQPALQQAIAGGSGGPMAVLVFTMLVPAAGRMWRSGDVNAIAMVGVALALMLFAAASGAYLVLALLPFLVLLSPPALLSRSAGGVLLVLLFPALFMVAGYLYVNWIFGGSALAFAASVSSVIRGAAANLGAHPWLLGWGHSVPGALLVGASMGFIGLPLLPVALWRVADRQTLFTLLMLSIAVISAIAIGSVTRYLDHPAQFLVYLTPVCVMALSAARPSRLGGEMALVLALAGLAGGWLVQGYQPAPTAAAWRLAMAGENVASPLNQDDAAFGLLLRDYHDIALDAERSGMVVPARGDGVGLVLISTDRLKADILSRNLSTRYVAVQDPDSPRGLDDRIGRAFPMLWRDGPAGGTLVASRGPWRLWQMPDPIKAGSGQSEKLEPVP
jgi:hypothetical protein